MDKAEIERLIRTTRERAEALGRSGNPERELRELSDSIAAVTSSLEEAKTLVYEGADEAELVKATVSGDGRLQTVEISAQAMNRLSADDLGPACLAAIKAARQKCSDELQFLNEPDQSGAVPDMNEMLERMQNELKGMR